MKSLMKKAVAGLTLTLITGTLLAQPAPSLPTSEPPAASMGVTLSVEEMTTRLGELHEQSIEDARQVTVLQLKARKDKDIIRLNCINDKLVQIKALRNILESAKLDFDTSASTESTPELQSKFANTSDAATQIRQLREAAFACAGEGELKSDQQSSWQQPDIPDDPGQDLFPDDLEPPGYASPFN